MILNGGVMENLRTSLCNRHDQSSPGCICVLGDSQKCSLARDGQNHLGKDLLSEA